MKEHYNEYNSATKLTPDFALNGTHQNVSIYPGTTTAAPLTFKSTFTKSDSTVVNAALLSTPVSGSMEYDGTFFYLTQGGARKKIDVFYDNTTVTGTTYSIGASNTVIFANAATNSITITLPSSSGYNGYRFYIKRTDGVSANTVTINTAGGNIDGSASQVLSLQYQAIMVVSDGSNWYIF